MHAIISEPHPLEEAGLHVKYSRHWIHPPILPALGLE